MSTDFCLPITAARLAGNGTAPATRHTVGRNGGRTAPAGERPLARTSAPAQNRPAHAVAQVHTRAAPAAPQRDLRDALGQFATGVTIVTTQGETGPLGLTVNSFAPVSLEPPLVVWSLRKESALHDAFLDRGAFAIHVLAAQQRELARVFSRPVQDRFRGLDVRPGHAGVPVLDACLARFECTTHQTVAAGDHTLFIGHVQVFHHCRDACEPALVFHRGQFGSQHPEAD